MDDYIKQINEMLEIEVLLNTVHVTDEDINVDYDGDSANHDDIEYMRY